MSGAREPAVASDSPIESLHLRMPTDMPGEKKIPCKRNNKCHPCRMPKCNDCKNCNSNSHRRCIRKPECAGPVPMEIDLSSPPKVSNASAIAARTTRAASTSGQQVVEVDLDTSFVDESESEDEQNVTVIAAPPSAEQTAARKRFRARTTSSPEAEDLTTKISRGTSRETRARSVSSASSGRTVAANVEEAERESYAAMMNRRLEAALTEASQLKSELIRTKKRYDSRVALMSADLALHATCNSRLEVYRQKIIDKDDEIKSLKKTSGKVIVQRTIGVQAEAAAIKQETGETEQAQEQPAVEGDAAPDGLVRCQMQGQSVLIAQDLILDEDAREQLFPPTEEDARARVVSKPTRLFSNNSKLVDVYDANLNLLHGMTVVTRVATHRGLAQRHRELMEMRSRGETSAKIPGQARRHAEMVESYNGFRDAQAQLAKEFANACNIVWELTFNGFLEEAARLRAHLLETLGQKEGSTDLCLIV